MTHNYDMFEKIEVKFGYTWELQSINKNVICILAYFENTEFLNLYGQDFLEFKFALDLPNQSSKRRL